MSDEAALRAAIIADPDDDTARLAYADWLDENRPDKAPSPAAGPSARAEFIRVQCRLAAAGPEDPDYAELLDREQDLADWLATHDPDPDDLLRGLSDPDPCDGGDWAASRRGFREVVGFEDWDDDPEATVDALASALEQAFPKTPARSLVLEDARADEIARFADEPVFGQLRGLRLDSLDDGDEDEAAAAVADSPRAAGLRRLYLDLDLQGEGCRALAGSRHLKNLESFALDFPVSARAVKHFAGVRWFRGLRRLRLWAGNGEVLRALADLPPMPRLVSLTVSGAGPLGPAAVKRFAASGAFPRLAHLRLDDARLSPDHVAALAKGRWPLRHLDLRQNDVRKAGCEALAGAAFARTLRVLDLSECDVTAGGVQALAGCGALAGLRRLDLSGNPVGPGGLAALAGSPHLSGLRALGLNRVNLARGPIAARHVLEFLSALAMPGLRHLGLGGLPVAVRGARALAAAPAFANLTRLELDSCLLGQRGAAAVVESKTLANLVYLDLSGNKVGAAVGKLVSRKVLPRLAYCLPGSGIPKNWVWRLDRRPGVRV